MAPCNGPRASRLNVQFWARGRLDSDRPDQYALFSRRDSSARPLPVWQECRVIAGGEFFFMNWQSADLLDGRYVRSIPSSAVIAGAQPVERLLDKHRNLFPYSAKTRRGIGRPDQCWLPLLSGGGACPDRAEPFVVEQSQSEAAAIHSPNSSLRLRSGSACRSIGSILS